MKTMAVGEFKTHFSEVLDDVKRGQSVTIAYGRQHKPVAMLVPYQPEKAEGIRLGTLRADQKSCTIPDDFAISDEDLLLS